MPIMPNQMLALLAHRAHRAHRSTTPLCQSCQPRQACQSYRARQARAALDSAAVSPGASRVDLHGNSDHRVHRSGHEREAMVIRAAAATPHLHPHMGRTPRLPTKDHQLDGSHLQREREKFTRTRRRAEDDALTEDADCKIHILLIGPREGLLNAHSKVRRPPYNRGGFTGTVNTGR